MKNEYLYVTSINLDQRLMVSNIDSTGDCYLVSYSCHPVCVTINQTIKMAGQSQRFLGVEDRERKCAENYNK